MVLLLLLWLWRLVIKFIFNLVLTGKIFFDFYKNSVSSGGPLITLVVGDSLVHLRVVLPILLA